MWVVVKGVDRDKWVTIRKIVVLLKASTAKAAEVVGANFLTGILDVVMRKNHQCGHQKPVYRRHHKVFLRM